MLLGLELSKLHFLISSAAVLSLDAGYHLPIGAIGKSWQGGIREKSPFLMSLFLPV